MESNVFLFIPSRSGLLTDLSATVSKSAQQLKTAVEGKSLLGNFTKEHEKFLTEKRTQQRREEAAVPPWVGYVEEEEMKKQILELSKVNHERAREASTENFLGRKNEIFSAVHHPVQITTSIWQRCIQWLWQLWKSMKISSRCVLTWFQNSRRTAKLKRRRHIRSLA